jgi:hypothetical protein
MRTSWEQARDEALQSAVRRGESRLLGEEPAQTSGEPESSSPSSAAMIASLISQVASKVKELVPSASSQAIALTTQGKVTTAVNNGVLAKPAAAPGVGVPASTKKYLIIGAGVLAGLGILWFVMRKKRSS